MLNTPRASEFDNGSGTSVFPPKAQALFIVTAKSSQAIWEYVNERIDGAEAARRVGKATAGAVGGLVINHTISYVIGAAGSSLGPLGQFACTVVGNMIGDFAAEAFTQWLNKFFRGRPEDAYAKACEELDVTPNAHRMEIKRAYAKFHPDRGSGLTPEQFERKKIAFELIRATRNRQDTWDDDEM